MSANSTCIMVTDENKEGHILTGIEHDVKVKQYDVVTMRFCKGGPTGGYWKIVSNESST